MKKVNLNDVPFEEWSSPGGKFHGAGRQISAALGAKTNATIGEGGHPFDLELGRLRPGKAGCPFHSHTAQWELFVILSGDGTVRFGDQQREVRAGDAVMHPPHEAHQLINTGSTFLEYLLVADNPLTEIWHYPDSKKWCFKPRGWCFLRQEVDYHLGEDDAGPPEPPRKPAPPPAGPLARFVTIDAIPENVLESPKKTYRSFTRDISLALGGIRDTGPWGGGHPFDLQMRRVPPGAAVCPFHAHAIQWELFIALAGTATVRAGDETHDVRAGDVFLQPPGTPHQIRNPSSEDFSFYVIADNTPAESIYYPDSQKWMIKPQRKIFRMTEVGYFDGEE